MFFYNPYAHIPLLKEELQRLLPAGSFASYLWRTIGNELHYRLVDWPFEDEVEYSSIYPVDALFYWISENGGLDPEWLASDDGSFLDDQGELIPKQVKPCYSGVEQLAAYGLWLISDLEPINIDHDCFDENGYDRDGQTRDFKIEVHASYCLFAYQALTYARRLIEGIPLSIEEVKKAESLNFSAFGKHAVAHRYDQILKPEWIDHCKMMIKSEANIRTLDDLLNVFGGDPRINEVTPRSLKSWAREAGITFRAGRPTK